MQMRVVRGSYSHTHTHTHTVNNKVTTLTCFTRVVLSLDGYGRIVATSNATPNMNIC